MSVSAILLLPAFTLALNESTALLVAGGTGQSGASRSVELWRPNQSPCHLPDLPEDVEAGTLDLLGNEPTLCQLNHCLHFTNNEWQNGSRTIFSRLILNKMTRIPEKKTIELQISAHQCGYAQGTATHGWSGVSKYDRVAHQSGRLEA